MTALQFADKVGRKKMADALEVGVTAVSNAVVREKFPPAWIETCRALAAGEDFQFPVHLFGQKGSYNTKGGFTSRVIQCQVSEKTQAGAQ